jgi:hypothetical protein
MEALKIDIINGIPPNVGGGAFVQSLNILHRHRISIDFDRLANLQYVGVNCIYQSVGAQLIGANIPANTVPVVRASFVLDGIMFHEFGHCLRFIEKGNVPNFPVDPAFLNAEEARNLTGLDLQTNTVDEICTLMYDLQKGRNVRFPYINLALMNINFSTDGILGGNVAETGIKFIIEKHDIICNL